MTATTLTPSEYNIVHKELKKAFGSASEWDCVDCGGQAREWSWNRDRDPKLVASYDARCAKCHRIYDGNAVGIKHGQARLTEQDVIDIRAKAAVGVFQWKLADEYGMSVRQIGKIVRRENWGHI